MGSKKARREEKLLKRKEKKNLLKRNKTCPNSPAVLTPGFISEPASPGEEEDVRDNAFPTTLLVEKAVKKLGKINKKNGRQKKLIMEDLQGGKSKKEVLAEFLNSSQFGREDFEVGRMDKKKQKKAKGVKRLIEACNKHKNFRRTDEGVEREARVWE